MRLQEAVRKGNVQAGTTCSVLRSRPAIRFSHLASADLEDDASYIGDANVVCMDEGDHAWCR
jgi:hypothetical protein